MIGFFTYRQRRFELLEFISAEMMSAAEKGRWQHAQNLLRRWKRVINFKPPLW